MAKQQEKNRPGENVGPIIQSNDPTVGKTAAQLSGTIGGWAWDGRRHCLVMLSCRHVFSNQQYKAVFGVNGLLADVFTTPTERPGYDLDASVADPLTPVTAKFEIQGLGMPAIFRVATFSQDTPVTAYSLMKGEKFTGTLRGAERLDAPLTSAGKQYDSKPYYALDADPGSEKGLVHGDSGTLVMAAGAGAEDATALGLFFWGPSTGTLKKSPASASARRYVHQLQDVFDMKRLDPLEKKPFAAFLGSVFARPREQGVEPFTFYAADRVRRGIGDPELEDYVGDGLRDRLDNLVEAFDLPEMAGVLDHLAQTDIRWRAKLLHQLVNDHVFRGAAWYCLRAIADAGKPNQNNVELTTTVPVVAAFLIELAHADAAAVHATIDKHFGALKKQTDLLRGKKWEKASTVRD